MESHRNQDDLPSTPTSSNNTSFDASYNTLFDALIQTSPRIDVYHPTQTLSCEEQEILALRELYMVDMQRSKEDALSHLRRRREFFKDTNTRMEDELKDYIPVMGSCRILLGIHKLYWLYTNSAELQEAPSS